MTEAASQRSYNDFVPYLFATSWGAKGHDPWLLPQWDKATKTRYDHGNLQFGTIEEDHRVILVCPGLPGYDKGDPLKIKLWNVMKYIVLMAQSIFNMLGFKSSCYKDAEDFYKDKIKGKFGNKEIVITGYCSGGSVAAYLGLKYGHETYCFNAVPIGTGLQKDIKQDNIDNNWTKINQISVEGDFMSDPSSIYCRIARLFGTKHFGNRYTVASAYPGDRNKTHMFFSASLFKEIFKDKLKEHNIDPAAIRAKDYSEFEKGNFYSVQFPQKSK